MNDNINQNSEQNNTQNVNVVQQPTINQQPQQQVVTPVTQSVGPTSMPTQQSAPVSDVPVQQVQSVEEPPAMDKKQFLINNGCDINKALELLGDMEMYDETIGDFLEEIDEKWQRIEKYHLEGNMPDYAIEVHSLKSDARYLGFYTLGDIAYNHELASKENNVQYVNEHYNELATEFEKTLKIIKAYKEMI